MPSSITLTHPNCDNCGKKNQPIFIDLIIKVMLCRGYANVTDKRSLTGERILDNVEALLKQVYEGKHLEIVTRPELRLGSQFYHIDILRKKALVQKGILSQSLGRDLEAQDCFLDCMETGSQFDPRIRKECISRLMSL